MFVEQVLWFCITFTCLSSPKMTYFSFDHLLQYIDDFGLIGFSGPMGFEQVFSEIKCFFKSLLFFSNHTLRQLR